MIFVFIGTQLNEKKKKKIFFLIDEVFFFFSLRFYISKIFSKINEL